MDYGKERDLKYIEGLKAALRAIKELERKDKQ